MNLVSESVFLKVKHETDSLSSTNKPVWPYNAKQPLVLAGKYNCEIEHSEGSQQVDFLVVKGNKGISVLRSRAAKDFSHIRGQGG